MPSKNVMSTMLEGQQKTKNQNEGRNLIWLVSPYFGDLIFAVESRQFPKTDFNKMLIRNNLLGLFL